MAPKDVRTLVVELVPHADAGDRGQWRGDQNARPLTDLGRRQAQAILADLRQQATDALFTSPALRCHQTIEPLASALGLHIVTLADLREVDPEDGPGAPAERALAALDEMKVRHPEGRVIACSHGDLIPALAGCISSLLGQDVRPLEHRGQRYLIEISDRLAAIMRREIADFPRS